MRDLTLAKRETSLGNYILVKGGLHYLKGNSSPYFSLTCNIYGADRDTILRLFPRFADLAALHLSDINGVPMYAVENGWYWLGRTKYQAPDLSVVARHFRITEEEAKALDWKVITKNDLIAWVEEQKPRWKAEADACIAKHHLVVFGDPWEAV